MLLHGRLQQFAVVRLISLFLLLVFVSAGAPLLPDASTAPARKLAWNGLVDAHYSYNFNRPSTQTNRLRNFDVYENQFGLSLVKLSVQHAAQPVGFRINFAAGPTNDVVHRIPPSSTNSYKTLLNLCTYDKRYERVRAAAWFFIWKEGRDRANHHSKVGRALITCCRS